MINKIVESIEQAVSDIKDNSVIAVGGFGFAGTPNNLLKALAGRKPPPRGLTLIGTGTRQFDYLVAVAGAVKRVISPYPGFPANLRNLLDKKIPLTQAFKRGEVEVEVSPLGNLVERIRAAGAGIPAFYTPVGVGTELTEGKEVRAFDGMECILERALKLDYALIKAYKGDRHGNLIYHGTSRCHNAVYAMAATCTIAEVDEVVELGQLDPEVVVTPGIFVHRVVKAAQLDPYQYFRDFFYEEMKAYIDYAHARKRT